MVAANSHRAAKGLRCCLIVRNSDRLKQGRMLLCTNHGKARCFMARGVYSVTAMLDRAGACHMEFPPQKMRAVEASHYLRMSVSKLARLRVTGDGPPYAKVGNRIVLYDKGNLDRWLEGQLRRSTAEYVIRADVSVQSIAQKCDSDRGAS